MTFKKNTISIIVTSIAFLFIFFFSVSDKALADTSSDDSWSIEVDEMDISSFSPTPSPKPYQPKIKIPKTIKEPDEIEPQIELPPFTITTSNILIDYGIISPTNPITRTSNIILSNISNSLLLISYEDTPPQITSSKITIPDTTCDNGSCSSFTAAPWENTLTYGFGFRCDNVTNDLCPTNFKHTSYYQQFPNISNKEAPGIIASKSNPLQEYEAEITYKMNISKNQPKGSYTNTITFIAAPGY